MTTHHLKTWPEYFDAIARGDKNFEVRYNDRDFQVGDVLVLQEWKPETELFTGKELSRIVTYVLPGDNFGITLNYCVMGLAEQMQRVVKLHHEARESA
jgi:ASC-1-like (ASCH) protein